MDKQFEVGDKVLHKMCDGCVERVLTVEYKKVLAQDGTVCKEGLVLQGDATANHYFAWLDVERANITPYGG